jgi:L-alanine-DL-glutamate epimerase-like enolase superfamily enzyme
MKLKALSIHSLAIPFKVRFKHSSAERAVTQSVLVAARTEHGTLGLGEGCPREYVTQETIVSAKEFFATHQNDLVNVIRSINDLHCWVEQHQTTIDRNPAAWCAIELALLDALAKEHTQSLEAALALPELAGPFGYTAVLGNADPATFTAQVNQYTGLGFIDFKVKITGDPSLDNSKYATILKARSDARIRLDANNLWRTADNVSAYLDAISIEPFALEEPLQVLDHTSLAVLANRHAPQLILDESFLNQHHFAPIENHPERFIINLRLSKMGGLIRSLQIAGLAAEKRIALIIGAQVGETSLLTRAALSVANICKENLIAQEGAFGTLLLERDITDQPLVFGGGGLLDTAALAPTCYGFQIDYNLNGILDL